jgi:hypothetical protein
MRHVLPAIGSNDPAALLTTMLERVEPEVGDVRGLIVTVNPEDPALVVKMVFLPLPSELALSLLGDRQIEPYLSSRLTHSKPPPGLERVKNVGRIHGGSAQA